MISTPHHTAPAHRQRVKGRDDASAKRRVEARVRRGHRPPQHVPRPVGQLAHEGPPPPPSPATAHRLLASQQQRYANDYSRFDNIRDSDDSSDSSDDDFHLATMT